MRFWEEELFVKKWYNKDMYKYLEHQADMGIYAQGKDWLEVFTDAARAVFELMYEIKSKVKSPKLKAVDLKVTAKDIADLFIEWLNELLAQRDIENIVFIDFKVKNIDKKGDLFILKGEALGEPLDLEKHQPKLEVKAATYAGLECGEKDGEKFCQCVVDV